MYGDWSELPGELRDAHGGQWIVAYDGQLLVGANSFGDLVDKVKQSPSISGGDIYRLPGWTDYKGSRKTAGVMMREDNGGYYDDQGFKETQGYTAETTEEMLADILGMVLELRQEVSDLKKSVRYLCK